MESVYTSVVIPVYNEEPNLESLFYRLVRVMEDTGRPYEIIFTNDGSTDGSFELLKKFHEEYPEHVRVIDFNGNFGQLLRGCAGKSS